MMYRRETVKDEYMEKCYIVPTPIAGYYDKCFMDIMCNSHLRNR